MDNNLNFNEYLKIPAMSSSGLKELVRSPAHYKAYIEAEPIDTVALNFGRASHKAILENDINSIICMPKIDKRTKQGKADYEEFIAQSEDKIVLAEQEYKTLIEMQKVALEHENMQKLLKEAKKEVSIFWQELAFDLDCKCRVDAICNFDIFEAHILLDYKTCIDASPDGFVRQIINYRYDIQNAWYKRGFQASNLGAECSFIFIAQEKTPPFAIGIYEIEEESTEF